MGLSAASAVMPPWHQYSGFLEPQAHAALLEWTLANRHRFKQSGVTEGVDLSRRISEKLCDLGPLHGVVEKRVRDKLPDIFSRTGGRPFEVEHVELEIAAHGDGAFFARHTDMPTGPGRKPLGGDDTGLQDRLVSAVYYYHREPKGFSGGALRLYGFDARDDSADYVEIEPEQNSLVVFPSWVSHEVTKVSCPSGDFKDCRFAVNAWLCKVLK